MRLLHYLLCGHNIYLIVVDIRGFNNGYVILIIIKDLCSFIQVNRVSTDYSYSL